MEGSIALALHRHALAAGSHAAIADAAFTLPPPLLPFYTLTAAALICSLTRASLSTLRRGRRGGGRRRLREERICMTGGLRGTWASLNMGARSLRRLLVFQAEEKWVSILVICCAFFAHLPAPLTTIIALHGAASCTRGTCASRQPNGGRRVCDGVSNRVSKTARYDPRAQEKRWATRNSAPRRV